MKSDVLLFQVVAWPLADIDVPVVADTLG